MIGLYDLLDLGLPEAAISAWLSGHDLQDMVDGVDLPPLSPRERRQVADAWWFIARPGQRWEAGVEFITDYECGRGHGKAVRLDTPLPTPTGWTTMGEVRVGDRLLDEQGRPCTITATHDVFAKEAWRLTFSDGEHVDACGDHQWVTFDQLERKRSNRNAGTLPPLWAYAPARSTRYIVATLRRGPRGDLNHCIPLTAPLALPDAALPLPPYVLGIWLGDGDSASPGITSHVDDAPHYQARVEALGLEWERHKVNELRPHVGHYRFGIRKVTAGIMRSMGVLGNKHIPIAYLRASYQQRLALMQGLVDTDGTIDKHSGQVEYCSMIERLAEDVAELARTLGQKPHISKGRAMLNGVDHGTKYRVFWRPTLQVASLPRKAALIQRLGGQRSRNEHRMIVSADPLEPQHMRCVTVDSPASMYLVGRGMIPTHNTLSGSNAIVDAARDPEQWGGEVVVVGPEPTHVKRDCLVGPSGIFAAAKVAERSGNGPGIRDQNWNDRTLWFDAPRGGGSGLVVHWAAASDPKSVHGLNVGLVWWDEFGVSNHRVQDAQGNNAWRALRPAVRVGPLGGRIIVTQTPSRAPEVRALWRDAERPECPRCRDAWTLERGPWRGEVGREPWRLPRSEQRRVHPLLNTRTTEPSRECPACGASITAEVRIVFGDTRDNPAIAARARADADRAIKSGAAHAHLAFAPRGEADASPQGALVRHEDVRMVEARWPDLEAAARRGQVPDPWMAVLGSLGAEEVVVVADPAVTSKEGSDETGVVASCRCPAPSAGGGDEVDEPDGLARAVGLQDASVRPDEVDGAPSATWGPRAHWLACCWGARRIVVETNNGGDEVLAVVRDLCARGLRESEVMARLRADLPELAGVPDARLSVLARRVAASSRGIAVESVGRRARKPVRLGWYGATAQMGRQALACVDRLGGAEHWRQALGQMTDYEQPAGGATDDKIDRGDAVCSAAQVVLGVRETHRGEVDDPAIGGSGWMDRVAGALAR